MSVASPMTAVALLRHDFITDYPSDAARILERMPGQEVSEALKDLEAGESLAAWESMSPDVAMRALALLPSEGSTAILRSMDPGRAVPILALFDPESRDGLLELLPAEQADELRLLLTYPPDSAGFIMDAKVLLLRPETTVKEALARIRALRRRGVRVLFVVDPDNRLEGAVDVQDLATSGPQVTLDEIMHPVKAAVNAMASREEVAELLDQHQLTDLPGSTWTAA